MFRRRSDFLLNTDSASSFLLVIVAITVFFTTLIIASTSVLQGIMERWYRDMSSTLTIQVIPVPSDSPTETQKRIERVVRILQNTPGISTVKSLQKQHITEFLKSLIDSEELVKNIQIPYMINVTLHHHTNYDDIISYLRERVPNISFDDHKAWLQNLVHIGCNVEIFLLIFILVVSSITIIGTMYSTLGKISCHYATIEILHIIGAYDDYIVLQFAYESSMQGLRGSFLGLILALPVFLTIITWLARHLEGDLWLTLTLQPSQMVIKLGIFLIGVIWLTKAISRWTVYRSLHLMNTAP